MTTPSATRKPASATRKGMLMTPTLARLRRLLATRRAGRDAGSGLLARRRARRRRRSAAVAVGDGLAVLAHLGWRHEADLGVRLAGHHAAFGRLGHGLAAGLADARRVRAARQRERAAAARVLRAGEELAATRALDDERRAAV